MRWSSYVFYLLLGYLIFSLVSDWKLFRETEPISYSEFVQEIEKGNVKDVDISTSSITGEFVSQGPHKASHFITVPVDDHDLVKRLASKNISFRGEPKSTWMGQVLAWVVPILLLYFLWSALFRKFTPGGGLLGLTKSKARLFFEKDISTNFSDVAGVDEAKEELKEIVEFLRDPKRVTRLGGHAPKGILLVGPPGTGKTLLARALAGEAKVPFYSINGSEFVEMFVGLGAARVRDLFQEARAHAPCLLFIDEIDALGKSRAFDVMGSGAHEEKEQTLHQLLAEMDGFDSSQGVIILGATNRPEVLDPALLRAGRFDRQVLVSLPDQKGREAILQVHIKKVKSHPDLKVQDVASLTSGFSGADLANVVNEAALMAARRGGDSVTQSDFTQAIERLIAGLERKSQVISPEEKNRVAHHEMGHATVALALGSSDKIQKISIIPRGIGSLGYTIQSSPEDRYLMEEDELLSRMAVYLGGRASEEFFFQNLSTGAVDDLARATTLARAMITQFAMGEGLGLVSFERPAHHYLGGSMASTEGYSEETAKKIDHEIRKLMDNAYTLALTAVEKNEAFIKGGVDQLLQSETLEEDQIQGLWKKHGYVLSPKDLANRWEHFSQNSDTGLRGYGLTLEEAFANAAKALTALSIDPNQVRAQASLQIQCEAGNLEELLIHWLKALVRESEERKIFFSEFDIKIDGMKLVASVRGEEADPTHHQYVRINSNVMMKDSSVRQEGPVWVVQCLMISH